MYRVHDNIYSTVIPYSFHKNSPNFFGILVRWTCTYYACVFVNVDMSDDVVMFQASQCYRVHDNFVHV